MTGPCRIAVVGATGSGKTSLSRDLAERLSLRCVEIDALHWGPNWMPATDDVLRERVACALASRRWVVDGNYAHLSDLTLRRAELLVWLDYSFPRTAWQLLRRTFRRAMRGEELWHGNRETFRKALASRDSILLWLVLSYGPVRHRYARLAADRTYPGLEIARFRSPAATRRWLASLPPVSGQEPQ